MNTYIHILNYLGKSDLIQKYTHYIWLIQIIVTNILKKKIILIKILLIILNHKIYYVTLINNYSLGLLGKSRKVKFLTSKITQTSKKSTGYRYNCPKLARDVYISNQYMFGWVCLILYVRNFVLPWLSVKRLNR